MRKIFSEKNIAGFLFVLVIVAFALAHEDSKKRSSNYNVSIKSVSPERPTFTITKNTTSSPDKETYQR